MESPNRIILARLVIAVAAETLFLLLVVVDMDAACCNVDVSCCAIRLFCISVENFD